MRQRRIRHLEEKLASVAPRFQAENPEALAGSWRRFIPGSGGTLACELGCGKGQFLVGMAGRHPDWKLVGIEGNENVLLYAMRKARDADCDRIRFVSDYVDELDRYFAENELDRLYINFCDPWPKNRHEKRRLTAPARLERYARALRTGGVLEFRTDNADLFEYSVASFAASGQFALRCVTRDFHGDSAGEGRVETEYEQKFSGMGLPIRFLRAEVVE